LTGGIRWLSVPPGCGFGDASESYLRGLRTAGIPVSWTPLGWPSPAWDAAHGPVVARDPDGAEHHDIAGRVIAHDTVVVCSPPLWHDRLRLEAGKRLLTAYTTWETDTLPAESVSLLNRYDRVLVPSRFNASVFEASGVTAPLRVVPHIARGSPPPRERSTANGKFTFYLIATWTSRKAILDVVSAYVTAFTAADDVLLVIHTTPEDLIASARPRRTDQAAGFRCPASWITLANALARHRRAPPIELSTRQLTRDQVEMLHARADCFVSLSRGEGWGLGAFDAGAFGKPVIVTGWGGTLEFLPTGYPYCVEYDLEPTTSDAPDLWWEPRPGERWARARVEHGAILMRRAYEHPDEAHEWGRILQATVTTKFEPHRVTSCLIDALA
jgi:glycosyltransferase involved in cell wall biosynthesis